MCWSPPYEQARAWLLGEAKRAGLGGGVDPAGNVFGGLGADRVSPDAPVVLTGSHIDTVPEGGILDGALGVMAGLECLHTIREAGTRPARPLAVAAWSDEEGRYGSLFGSRALCRPLQPPAIPSIGARRRGPPLPGPWRAGLRAHPGPPGPAPRRPGAA